MLAARGRSSEYKGLTVCLAMKLTVDVALSQAVGVGAAECSQWNHF